MKIKVNFIDDNEQAEKSFAERYGAYTRSMIEAKNAYATKYGL